MSSCPPSPRPTPGRSSRRSIQRDARVPAALGKEGLRVAHFDDVLERRLLVLGALIMGLGDPIADPIPKIARPLRRSDAVIEPVGAHGRLALLRHELGLRSEEHTSELQSLMRISYAVFCLKKKTN